MCAMHWGSHLDRSGRAPLRHLAARVQPDVIHCRHVDPLGQLLQRRIEVGCGARPVGLLCRRQLRQRVQRPAPQPRESQ